jgi:hypothetical protein
MMMMMKVRNKLSWHKEGRVLLEGESGKVDNNNSFRSVFKLDPFNGGATNIREPEQSYQ